jgi:hypothetical protein
MPLVTVGLVSSVALLLFRWDPRGWWGLAIDAALAGAFIAAGNLGLLREEPRQNVRGSRILRRLASTVFFSLIAYVGASSILWPWHRCWGTSRSDLELQLPGDPPDRNAP